MATKLCIVTGANKGIGFEIARKIGIQTDYKVIIACRNKSLGLEAQSRLSSEGINVDYEQLDLEQEDSIVSFAARMASKYTKIDVLVNNGAIAFKNADPTPFQLQAEPTLKVNFFGTLHLTKALLPLIKNSGHPRIVNVASVAGHLKILKSDEKKDLFTSPSITMEELEKYMSTFVEEVKAKGTDNAWSNTCYGMSKLGVICMTRILARDEPGIRVNCFCPGFCSTDMSSHRGSKTPEEGARSALFLSTIGDDGPSGKFYSNEVEAVW